MMLTKQTSILNRVFKYVVSYNPEPLVGSLHRHCGACFFDILSQFIYTEAMQHTIAGKTVDVIAPTNLYKWASVWGRIQKNYYKQGVYLRREKQIEDFVSLNGFAKYYVIKDTDVLQQLQSEPHPSQADITIITDQKFSRLPCTAIIQQIQTLLDQCPRLYLCLNRHYINIDNTYHNSNLDPHFPRAVTQWLVQELGNTLVLDMSLDVLDCGDWFTWVIPDRMYYIQRV